MNTNELEAMAVEVSEQTGRSLDECRNGLRREMARMLAAMGGDDGLAKANAYLESCGLPYRIRNLARI